MGSGAKARVGADAIRRLLLVEDAGKSRHPRNLSARGVTVALVDGLSEVAIR